MVLVRTVLRGRSRIHLFGVEGYASARGGDELFALIEGQRPTAILMESFSISGHTVGTGAELPYRSHLCTSGLSKALHLVSNEAVRASLTCEAVGVLTALRFGAEIRFADRPHTDSFDRLIARVSMDELRDMIIEATEVFAAAWGAEAPVSHNPIQVFHESLVPQNVLCPLFGELWGERHAVMAHIAKVTADESKHDVALVIGVKHVNPVAERLENNIESDINALLQVRDNSTVPEDELEKRAALAALLVATHSFPAEYVLPAEDAVDEKTRETIRRVYPRYRWAISARLNSAQADGRSSYDRLAEAIKRNEYNQSVMGLSQLEALCSQLASE